MILKIDTTDKTLIEVSLKNGNQILDKLTDNNPFGSQVLLPLIDKILKKNRLKKEDLAEIEVSTGPGSYTGTRVGVSVANALGFSLDILVNGKKIETDLRYT